MHRLLGLVQYIKKTLFFRIQRACVRFTYENKNIQVLLILIKSNLCYLNCSNSTVNFQCKCEKAYAGTGMQTPDPLTRSHLLSRASLPSIRGICISSVDHLALYVVFARGLLQSSTTLPRACTSDPECQQRERYLCVYIGPTQGLPRVQPGSTQGLHRVSVGSSQCLNRVHIGSIQGLHWVSIGSPQGLHRVSVGSPQGLRRVYIVSTLGPHWVYLGPAQCDFSSANFRRTLSSTKKT